MNDKPSLYIKQVGFGKLFYIENSQIKMVFMNKTCSDMILYKIKLVVVDPHKRLRLSHGTVANVCIMVLQHDNLASRCVLY